MNAPVTLILDDGVSIQDVARAFQFTDLAVSNTIIPGHYLIQRTERRLPQNVVEFPLPAMVRRQAD